MTPVPTLRRSDRGVPGVRGLRPPPSGAGASYVVRRSLDGERVYSTDNSGALTALTALDAATGVVLRQTTLTVGGIPTCALSLAVAPQGRLLVGTVDGRVLEYG